VAVVTHVAAGAAAGAVDRRPRLHRARLTRAITCRVAADVVDTRAARALRARLAGGAVLEERLRHTHAAFTRPAAARRAVGPGDAVAGALGAAARHLALTHL